MNTDARTIVHLDLDTFFVSVERLQNSKLIGKPILIGGISDRGVVASCSYEARAYGIHSAMPMRLARMLCKHAIVIRGDMDQYSKYSRMVTNIIEENAPLYEKASIDEHYIDITGMDRFFGNLKWTTELRQKVIHETGLPISFGLSTNKTVSKIATGEAKPNGLLQIQSSQVLPFLFPLSIRKIPMIGDKVYHLLRSMGITTIKTLSVVPPEMLEHVMGKNGIIIWRKANGIDPTPVKPYSERKSIGTESTFNTDTIDVIWLRQKLISMVEKLAFQLREKNKLASVITVKIRYANFDTHTLQKHIPYTTFDHILIKEALEMFDRLYQRRMLLRLVGVKFSGLVGGWQQLNMFEDTPEMTSLYQAMDRIKTRFGEKLIKRAVGIKTAEERLQIEDTEEQTILLSK
ncbi:MAG: DNA polymerase IV [Bacteroidetes bacterium HGW-Bacteroidetes-17]|jgi:DNA polymerase-4|nr:MAG: DNA polymerase IV [Bacteroidetes bacterium HGW-Bacteroidetes-17]